LSGIGYHIGRPLRHVHCGGIFSSMPKKPKRILVERIRFAASEGNEGLTIQISAVVAGDFYRYLKSRGVPCSEPHPVAFSAATVRNGTELSVASVCEMTAVGTMKDFERWRKELPFPSDFIP
jgi:hypothetical protein